MDGAEAAQAATGAKESATQRLERAYHDHYDRVFYLALRYGRGNEAWAEDIAQDTFIALADNLHKVDPELSPGPWLSRVCINKCINKLKRERFFQTLIPSWLHGKKQRQTQTPELLVGARESVQTIWLLIQDLPPKERVAFMMYRLDQMTMDEIGEQLGHSKGYISKLVKRAEGRLQAAGWREA